MAIHYPSHYRYALFENWDKKAFELIKEIGKNDNYPKLLGTTDDKNIYLITLIRTQKSLHDWRGVLKDTLEQVKQHGAIDTKLLTEKYPSEGISKDAPAWVTYEEDKIVNDFIDQLETRKISFVGTDEEKSEFIIRFILGQLGHDWEQTIMMIWEMLGDGDTLNIRDLNIEMRNFDYLGLFKTS